MEHNIGLNSELKLVQSLHWKDFSVSIATRHVVQWTDLGYFTTASLAYAEAVCRRYMADNAKPLWWRTQTIGATVRPILRTKARARMNAAFREALLNAGYDTQGRRLPGQQEQTRSGNKATKGLTGTVVIKSHLPIETHKIPYSDLLEYCERVVEAVEQANRRRSGDTGKEPKAGQESRPGDRGHKGRGSRGGSGGSEGRGGRGSAAKKAGESSQRRPQRTWNHRDTT
ncbi:hypothetical protein diail_10996 [Diaporthe ilicicola]|nr:hypothetical protein diail_10996 [Diaporthe ilicicola]